MLKVGMFGATGSYDFGDYAMMVHNIQEINSLIPNTSFVIFTLDREVTTKCIMENIRDIKIIDNIEIVVDRFPVENNFWHKKIHKLYKVFGCDYMEKYYNVIYEEARNNVFDKVPEYIVKAIREVDVCIFNGGGYIQHSWGNNNIRFMIEILLAKSLKKRVFFLSSSIGPMKMFERYIRETMSLVDRIMIRDGKKYSWNTLDCYGIEKKISGPDDLFNAIDFYSDSNQQLSSYVIIEVMSWIKNSNKGEAYVVKILVEFINYLTKNNKKILLINFDKNDKFAMEVINHIKNSVDNSALVDICLEIRNMYDVFNYYRNCEYSLSFKYHPVILALGSCKPCSAIITDSDGYYESKLNGAFENCCINPSNHVIHIDDLTFEKLVDLYNKRHIVIDISIKNRLINQREKYLNFIIRN